MMNNNSKMSNDDNSIEINNLYNFLSSYEVKKSENNSDDKVIFSHTTLGKPWKKYNIPADKLLMFYDLYLDALQAKALMHFVEKPREIGPLIIDMDLKFDKSANGERKYSETHILKLVKIVSETIAKYTDFKFETYVFEKKEPCCKKDGGYKDGIHIINTTPLSISMRYLIINEVQKKVEEQKILSDVPFINSYNDVFDKSIIETNGIVMYGSKKHEGVFYYLTYVFEHNGETYKKKCDRKEIIINCSNRLFNDVDECEYIDKNEVIKLKEYSNTTLRPKKIPTNNNNDIQKPNVKVIENKDVVLATKLANILSEERATEYESWRNVCYALKNTSPTKLLGAFHEFSKKSNKYDERACNKFWNDARCDGVGYTISSLYHWAKKDNLEEYKKIVREHVTDLFDEALSKTEYDVGKLVHGLYGSSFRCSNLKHDSWFEFQGHRWVPVEQGYTLDQKISEELTKEFAKILSIYYDQLSRAEGTDKDKILKKTESVQILINKLKSHTFKKNVMSECKKKFFDPKFEARLDAKNELIGFNNGVYNLETGKFRDGTPDDYVMLSCGYDYNPNYTLEHEDVVGVINFFKQIQTEDNMRDYLCTLLSSYLDGSAKDQKFIIWTGIGSNGKSTCVEFFQSAFGEYCGVLPITVLTSKRAKSGAATPELASMRGIRFAVFQEPEHDDVIYVGLMKELSGCDKITARGLFKDPIVFKPQFKLLLTCNKLPHIPSQDFGTWRRLRVTPWESEFVDGKPAHPKQFKKDKELSGKFEQWKGALMWYLLTYYYPIYKKGNMIEPEKVTQFTNKYQRQNDIIFEFMDAYMEKTDDVNNTILVLDFYSRLKDWYNQSYANKCAKTKKDIVAYLEEKGYIIKDEYIHKLKFKELKKNPPTNVFE